MRQDQTESQDRYYNRAPEPGTSRDQHGHRCRSEDKTPNELAQEQVDNMIRRAEESKARILEVSGNEDLITYAPDTQPEQNQNLRQLEVHSHHPAIVDKDYLVVGNYIEEAICQKIENNEFVDFA